jgi:hypothetical protein
MQDCEFQALADAPKSVRNFERSSRDALEPVRPFESFEGSLSAHSSLSLQFLCYVADVGEISLPEHANQSSRCLHVR